MKRDFLSIADWSAKDLQKLLDLSADMKARPGKYKDSIRGKSVALIFEKQSLRTHVTFDVGIYQLGGHSVYLTQSDINLGKRESIYDVSKNLERWMDAVVVRTYAHQSCRSLAISGTRKRSNLVQFHPIQTVDRPLIHWLRAERPVKGNRLLVPVEYSPLESAAATFLREP